MNRAHHHNLSRPRCLAGGTLGLAGVGAAAVLALSGTAATAPAFAVTRAPDGSVLVRESSDVAGSWITPADDALVKMGIRGEQIAAGYAPGPARHLGAVTCTPLTGPATPVGPQVRVLFDHDGTGVLPTGNSGVGGITRVFHLAGCNTYRTVKPSGKPSIGPQPTGNTGGNTGYVPTPTS